MKRITINVNGVDRPLIVDPAKNLADVLREQLLLETPELTHSMVGCVKAPKGQIL